MDYHQQTLSRTIKDIIVGIEYSLRSLIKNCGGDDNVSPSTLNIDINILLDQIEQDVYDILRETGVPYIGPFTSLTQPSSNFPQYSEDNSISPEQLALFSKDQLEKIKDTQLISLTVQSLPLNLVSSLTAEQLNEFTQEQLIGLSLSQRNVINKEQDLLPNVLSVITRIEPKEIPVQLTNLQLKLWTPEQIKKLTKQQLNNLTISSLSPELISTLTTEQLKSLTSYQTSLLRKDYLSVEQQRAIPHAFLINQNESTEKLSYDTVNRPYSQLQNVVLSPKVKDYIDKSTKEENKPITDTTGDIVSFLSSTIQPSIENLVGGMRFLSSNLNEQVYERFLSLYQKYLVFNGDTAKMLLILIFKPEYFNLFFTTKVKNERVRNDIINIIFRAIFIKVPVLQGDTVNSENMYIFREQLVEYSDVQKDTETFKKLKKSLFPQTNTDNDNNVVFGFRVVKKLYELAKTNSARTLLDSKKKINMLIYLFKNLQYKIAGFSQVINFFEQSQLKNDLYEFYVKFYIEDSKTLTYAFVSGKSDIYSFKTTPIKNTTAYNLVSLKPELKLGVLNAELNSYNLTDIFDRIKKGQNIIIVTNSTGYIEESNTLFSSNTDEGLIPYICRIQNTFNSVQIKAHEVFNSDTGVVTKEVSLGIDNPPVISKDSSQDIAIILNTIASKRDIGTSSHLIITITLSSTDFNKSIKIIIISFAVNNINSCLIQDMLYLDKKYTELQKIPLLKENVLSKQKIVEINNLIDVYLKLSRQNNDSIDRINEFLNQSKPIQDLITTYNITPSDTIKSILIKIKSKQYVFTERWIYDYIRVMLLESICSKKKDDYKLIADYKQKFDLFKKKVIIKYSKKKFMDLNPLIFSYLNILGCNESISKIDYHYNYEEIDIIENIFSNIIDFDLSQVTFVVISIVNTETILLVDYLSINDIKYVYSILSFLEKYTSTNYYNSKEKQKNSQLNTIMLTLFENIKQTLSTHPYYSKLIQSSKELKSLLYSLKKLPTLKKLIDLIDSMNNLTPIGILDFNKQLTDDVSFTCDNNNYNLGTTISDIYTSADKLKDRR